MGRGRQRGQELVEFALIAPVLFFIALGAFDLLRAVQVNTTVSDAARQGARQAVAAAVVADQPFAAPNGGACSGTAYTGSATGTGCLTDAAITTTARAVLGSVASAATTYTATAAACPTPAQGQASICISPNQTARNTEWTAPSQQGSFLVTVTVVTRYAPLTPAVATLLSPALVLKSSTSMVAEY